MMNVAFRVMYHMLWCGTGNLLAINSELHTSAGSWYVRDFEGREYLHTAAGENIYITRKIDEKEVSFTARIYIRSAVLMAAYDADPEATHQLVLETLRRRS